MKRIAKKVISIFLALSMTLQIAVTAYAESGVDLSGIISSGGDTLPAEECEEETYTEEPKVLIGELKDKRTENTKHFLYDDGTVVAAQYDTAVHYLDENGE